MTGPLADHIQLIEGADQSAGQGGALAGPIVVRLFDAQGAPLANAPVQWRVIEGGGSLASADSLTNASGEARASWVVGLGVGQNLLLVATRGATLTVKARSERRFTSVAAGLRHSCALSTLNEAFCWGDNGSGQVGDDSGAPRTRPVSVNTVLRFTAITTGFTHTCGLVTDGTVACWGDNRIGQLGVPAVPSRALAPVPVPGLTNVVAVTAGFIHTCALTQGGEVWCWGGNGSRQLGLGDAVDRNVPTKLPTLSGIRSISAGEFHTCAVTTANAGTCWGWNSLGEVASGLDYNTYSPLPVPVYAGVPYKQIGAGVRHTCAAAMDGAWYCWGRNGAGEIGLPPFEHSGAPVKINSTLSFQYAGAGNVHSCALTEGATKDVWCIGSDGFNNIGTTPRQIISGVDGSLTLGVEHTCVIKEGAVWCWGANQWGQLGNGSAVGSGVPVKASF